MDSDQKIVAALGRPFTLGMLYDAYKDELHTGFTLWDRKTLEEHISEQPQHSSSFEVTTSDSFESKSSLLDVDASLKASFLGGLVEVEGSAKYLNNQKQSKNHSRVTLQYKANTSFQKLSMSEEEAKNKPSSAVGSATHVVTGILYGANAFFVFDSEKLDTSSVQKIQGSMHALIKKIPSVEIDAKVGIKLTDEEKAFAAKFSCNFIGDFILPKNPSTFEEAVQTYKDLPKLLEKDIGVPLKVWLTPLKKFSPTAAELKGTICPDLVREAENALEDIRQAEVRCNELLNDDVVENVPPIKDKLRKFQNHCEGYKLKLQQLMEKSFPLIRKGQSDHSSVEKVLEERKDSPFSHDNLDKWLTNREREVNVIRSCVDMVMDGTNVKMVAHQSDLDREILAKGADQALCFAFTSVKRDDPFLDQMVQYLDTHGPSSKKNEEQDPWYYSDTVVLKMREKAAAFHDFASALKNKSRFCFLVATLPNEKYQGATIYRYNDGVLVNDDFSQPNIPDVKKVTDREVLIQYACDLTMDPNTVNKQLILSDGNKRVTVASEPQTYPDHPERFDSGGQLLCREGLTGRHYWEVEWAKYSSGYSSGVGVAYKSTERKGDNTGLGSNAVSWFLGMECGGFNAQHNVHVWNGPLPPSGCSRLGVFLDWPAGTLSFYDATSSTLSHLYTFYTKFSEPVYPGFWLYTKSNYIYLRPLQ